MRLSTNQKHLTVDVHFCDHRWQSPDFLHLAWMFDSRLQRAFTRVVNGLLHLTLVHCIQHRQLQRALTRVVNGLLHLT
jgi:hypothetical protein